MEKVNDSFHLSRTFRYDIIYIIQLICSYLSFLFWKGGFSLKIPKNNLQASIVLPSILFIGIVIISCIFFPDRTDTILSIVKEYIFSSFSWVYILCVAFFFLFLVILCLGKLGDIRLGNEDEKPEFSFFSWLCMLFSAGMGIGLMFFGVAEPISHLSAPLHGSASSLVQTKEAMLNTLFHWGIHAWAIYGIIGLALAYFGFRYQLPVTLRSGFYPLLKHRLNGFWGNLIDIVALCATIFGLTTTLGFGAMQLNAGLSAVGIFFDSLFFPHRPLDCHHRRPGHLVGHFRRK